MASNNKGKIFEQQWQSSAKDDNIFCYRLRDNDLSFNGNSVSTFTNSNPCDFFLFGNIIDGRGKIFAIELKSSKYNSIGIQRTPDEPESMIKAKQINSLIQLSLQNGMVAGFILNYRDDDTNEEETFFVSIERFSDFLMEKDKKSINKKDAKEYGLLIEQTIKRKYYRYNVSKMIEDIVEEVI